MANPIQCCLYLQGWWEVRVEAFVRRTSAWCGLCRYQCRWNVYPLSVTFRLTILQKKMKYCPRCMYQLTKSI